MVVMETEVSPGTKSIFIAAMVPMVAVVTKQGLTFQISLNFWVTLFCNGLFLLAIL